MIKTREAIDAFILATDIAVRFGAGYVGTEHLVYALMTGDFMTARAFSEEDVATYGELLDAMSSDANSDTLATDRTPALSPRLTIVENNAELFAKMLGDDRIGTGHLLLGVLREPESVACRLLRSLKQDTSLYALCILHDMGLSTDQARDYVRFLREGVRDSETGVSFLESYCRCLSDDIEDGLTEPVIGRREETDSVIRIMSRRTKNNPCLIGEPGVGKTAVVEAFAKRILDGDVPEALTGMRLYSLDIASLVAGTRYRGDFEERIKKLLMELEQNDKAILFIDELHSVIGAGGAEGTLDAANILKTSLSTNRLRVIGATTADEYRRYISKDPALERRFQPLTIEEPTPAQAYDILRGIVSRYEDYHGVRYTDEALHACVDLSVRYLGDRRLPDKAIDVLDETGSAAKLKLSNGENEEISRVLAEKEKAIIDGDFALAASLGGTYRSMQKARGGMNCKAVRGTEPVEVTEDAVREVVARMTGIPVARLSQTEGERLLGLEEELHRMVIGQNEAVSALAKAVRRGRVGLKDPNRPVGSFLFLGPTGVGKTELCRALAQALFGDAEAMIRIDMSEYMESHSVSKLIGSPPGYVGFEDGGQLCERVRRKPYSVLLFDEIEKAHPDVFNILLQVLDDGRITDSQGRVVNMKNTVIVMTSNAGAERIMNPKTLGFASENDAVADYNRMKEGVMEEVKKMFRPEFLNRIDDILVFHTLTKEEIRGIAELLLGRFAKSCEETLRLTVSFTEPLTAMIAEKGYSPLYGARPVRRLIAETVEDAVTDSFLRGIIKEGDTVRIDWSDGKVSVLPEETA